MHKPTLAQHAAFIVTNMNDGNAEWLRESFFIPAGICGQVSAFSSEIKQQDFFYWETDVAIGVDNDPCTFFRPDESSGSVISELP